MRCKSLFKGLRYEQIINWRASIVAALWSDAPAQSSERRYGSDEREVGVV